MVRENLEMNDDVADKDAGYVHITQKPGNECLNLPDETAFGHHRMLVNRHPNNIMYAQPKLGDWDKNDYFRP